MITSQNVTAPKLEEEYSVPKRVEYVRSLINKSAGKGYPGVRKKDGHWDGYEHVFCDKIIGVDGWSNTKTRSMKIHYGVTSNSVHAVPKYDGAEKTSMLIKDQQLDFGDLVRDVLDDGQEIKGVFSDYELPEDSPYGLEEIELRTRVPALTIYVQDIVSIEKIA